MKKQEQENKEQEKNYMKLYHSENKESKGKAVCYFVNNYENFIKIIYVFLTIFLYLLKCPQSLIL